MNTYDVMIDRNTANDESAVVSMVYVTSGTHVMKDEPIFEIENSKATEEYVAPGSGVLMHDLVAGQTVNFGVSIARIVPAGSEPTEQKKISAPSTVELSPLPAAVAARDEGAPRFSLTAAALLVRHGLSASQFDADFVTANDVLAHLQCQSQIQGTSFKPAPVPALGPAVGKRAGTPVGQRKRAEIEALSHGAGQSMLSVLGVGLGPLVVRRKPGDFLADRITDLVLYEASRLMRKYPRLNAHYSDGHVFLHEAVHAGLAIDDGGRLMVYGLENADETGLPELADGIADAVSRYANGELTAQELTRSTFTVTDLSAGELDFVLPLLPRGQSCIVGITQSAKFGFRLFAGFDHRVTEGREVMAFLGDLRDRIVSFSSPERTVLSASVCAFCARSAWEAVTSSKEKGLLKVVGRDGEEVLCCGSCWNGW
jgi:pyruvate/2-oxoglutarate dehydrogenase complex dihydrolipoamide acyltransferase (E2) component